MLVRSLSLKSYRLEGFARACPRDQFYEWYTDFSPEDPDLVNRYIEQKISAKIVKRRIIKKDGNLIVYENTVVVWWREIKSIVEAALDPESFSYVATITSPLFHDERKYSFIENTGGTSVVMVGAFAAKALALRLPHTFGLLNDWYLQQNRAIMDAFCRAAEAELPPKKLGIHFS